MGPRFSGRHIVDLACRQAGKASGHTQHWNSAQVLLQIALSVQMLYTSPPPCPVLGLFFTLADQPRSQHVTICFRDVSCIYHFDH